MSTTDFLHGVEFIELDEGGRPIQVVRSSVIGIVGTAPGADDQVFPLDTPVLISGSPSMAAKLKGQRKDVTEEGTLPNALDAIFDQHHGLVVVVRVQDTTDDEGKVLLPDADIRTNVAGDSAKFTGVHALLDAKNVCGVKPKLIIAPGFTDNFTKTGDDYAKNDVAGELEGIANKLRAIAIIDAPNDENITDTQVTNIAGLFGSPRIYLVHPFVSVYRNGELEDEPASARVAGVIARTDAEKGFWWSPSNKEIFGIAGIAKPIPFELGDKACVANVLNNGKVATIVREDGFRLWGNRTCSSDQRWAFISTRRIADMINESIQQAHLWAVDRPVGRVYYEAVTESVNQFLRTLIQKGAILGGKCWVDEELNSPSEVEQGNVYFDFDFTPAYTAEHITFRSRMTNGYVEEVFK